MTAPDQAAGGAFWAVEGIDGSGKSGVVAHLAGELRARGRDVVVTREPGGTAQGEALRALLLGSEGAGWDLGSELLLMTAARIQHVRDVVRPAVARGAHVVSDRFVGSTIAYQGAGRGLPIDRILDLHRAFVDDCRPDLTIVLDVDVATGLGRSRARLAEQAADEGRFEALDRAFHDRVRASFLEQAAADPARHVVIDAGQSADAVRKAVLDAVLGAALTR